MTPQRPHPLTACLSFRLDPAQVGSVGALAAELGRCLADAALTVAPQRIGP